MQAGTTPSDCTTPPNEVCAQMFDGGSEGTFPVLLEYDYHSMEPMVKQPWKGLQQYHNFQFLDDGCIRVWRSYGIGEGKRFEKDDLDRNYLKYAKNRDTSLSKDVFPQSSTNSSFSFSPKSELLCSPKTEPCPKRKRKLKLEKAEKKWKRTKNTEEQLKKHNDNDANDNGRITMNFICTFCETVFPTENALNTHCCDGRCVSCQCIFQSKTELEEHACHGVVEDKIEQSDKDLDIFVKCDDEVFKTPKTSAVEGSTLQNIPMGGGFNLFRSSGCVDKGILAIINGEVHKGFKNPGCRKSILEMKATCEAKVPAFIQPDLSDIQSMVGQILSKGKGKGDFDAKKSDGNKMKKPRIPKTEMEKKHAEGGKLKRDEKNAVTDRTKRHLFLAKYLRVCLIDDNKDTRVVRGVRFKDNEKGGEGGFWTVEAVKAKPHRYDDRLQVMVSSPQKNVRYMKIGNQLTNAIKRYNEHYYELCIPHLQL